MNVNFSPAPNKVCGDMRYDAGGGFCGLCLHLFCETSAFVIAPQKQWKLCEDVNLTGQEQKFENRSWPRMLTLEKGHCCLK